MTRFPQIKALVFTPQILICYIMLAIIIFLQVNNRPVDRHTHLELDKDNVIREYSNTEDDEYYTMPANNKVIYPIVEGAYGTHTLTYRDMKDYQVSITPDGKYVVFYDYDRLAGVVPLDDKCNLTKFIYGDND